MIRSRSNKYLILFLDIISPGGNILFDWILEFLSSLGLLGVFIGVFLEAIGLPFPGSVLVAFAGFLSKQGKFNIIIACLVSLIGYLLGSISAFMIGRHIGKPFIKKWGRYIRLTPERIDKAQKLLEKSAPVYVIGGRFVPTVGNITPYVASISGISIAKFLIYDMIHALLWLTAFLGFGAMLGSEWYTMVENPWFKWGAIGGVLLIVVYVLRDLLFVRNKNSV
jgi:membrane protein DedA with SNARE-associated domain